MFFLTIEEICKNLGVEGKIISCDVIKSGHINDTFKITTRSEKGDCEYIVQQINTYVFKKPVKMMDNISRVTSHISAKVGDERDRMVLNFLKNEKGESCFFDNVGKLCFKPQTSGPRGSARGQDPPRSTISRHRKACKYKL